LAYDGDGKVSIADTAEHGWQRVAIVKGGGLAAFGQRVICAAVDIVKIGPVTRRRVRSR
jgi:hypothetical protein